MNTLFPGRANYIGPTSGVFAFVHHEILCEWSNNINVRLTYVRDNKPIYEQKVRLSSIMYIPESVCPTVYEAHAKSVEARAKYDEAHAKSVEARAKSVEARAKSVEARAKYDEAHAKCDDIILAYVLKHQPTVPWNGKTLTF